MTAERETHRRELEDCLAHRAPL